MFTSVEQLKGLHSTSRLLPQLENISLRWKYLIVTNTLTYCALEIDYSRKTFYSKGPQKNSLIRSRKEKKRKEKKRKEKKRKEKKRKEKKRKDRCIIHKHVLSNILGFPIKISVNNYFFLWVLIHCSGNHYKEKLESRIKQNLLKKSFW